MRTAWIILVPVLGCGMEASPQGPASSTTGSSSGGADSSSTAGPPATTSSGAEEVSGTDASSTGEGVPWPDLDSGLDERPSLGACAASQNNVERLSEHSCFEGTPPRPIAGLVPYSVRAPLWSDGLQKNRYLGVPDDQVLTFDADGQLDLPVGTVLVKEFGTDDSLVETRVLARQADGTYQATTFVWQRDQQDALREDDGVQVPLDSQSWPVPSADACFDCHTEATGLTLGVRLDQLNRDHAYPSTGRSANQIATWANIGLLDVDALDQPESLPALPTYDGPAPVGERARAYLDVNCGVCHRPGSMGAGTSDLRFELPLHFTNTCGTEPEFGDPWGAGGNLIEPGDPEQSVLLFRTAAVDPNWRMPPLGSTVVDPLGVELLTAWIESLRSCDGT